MGRRRKCCYPHQVSFKDEDEGAWGAGSGSERQMLSGQLKHVAPRPSDLS